MSENAVKYCKEKYGDRINWVCGDAFDKKFNQKYDYGFCNFFTFFNSFDYPEKAQEYGTKIMRHIRPNGFLLFVWYTDLTAIRLPPHRFRIMNFTAKQLEHIFSGFQVESYAIDSRARIPLFLGKYSFNKYITRLSCATVNILASSWRRVRIISVVYHKYNSV
jgi:hypothetical protein